MVLLGKRFKDLRNNSKLTQNELAQLVGVTKSTIAAYENDSRQPSYEVLIKMASVFKVSTDSLLFEKNNNVINVSGLSREQLDVIDFLITYFRKCNSVDAILLDLPLDIRKQFEECVNIKLIEQSLRR